MSVRTPRTSTAQALHIAADLVERLAFNEHLVTPAQMRRHAENLRLWAEEAKRMEITVDELVAEAQEEADIARRRAVLAEQARLQALNVQALQATGKLIVLNNRRAAFHPRLGGAA